MASRLTERQILDLLEPYLPGETPSALGPQLGRYLDVLLRWNAKLNLTSIREPVAIVQRHFGESLFAAAQLPREGSLLDLGSGAGFPGVPIKLLHPQLTVTLAESQAKKAAFLREVGRVIGAEVLVWQGRAEELLPGVQFDTVTLRAVDNMPAAVAVAASLARDRLCLLCGTSYEHLSAAAPEFQFEQISVPESTSRFVLLGERQVAASESG